MGTARPRGYSRHMQRRNSNRPRILAVLPEATVLRHWMQLYESGKNAGYADADASRYAGKADQWALVQIPHNRYDADWNNADASLSKSQEERARRYAASTGTLPPGMASYSTRAAKQGKKRAYVSDGNHRAYAAYLRGEPAALFYMPLPDAQRFIGQSPTATANPRKQGRRRVVR